MRTPSFRASAVGAGLLSVASLAAVDAFQSGQAWPPPVKPTPTQAPTLSAEDEAKTLVLPPGYRAELVAKEPVVIDPIAIDFDADGRLWVLEMPGFMSEPNAANSREPINNVVVLEDTDHDGVMDKRTVFADKLVLPRAFKVLDDGVLVGEPPNLWLMKDTNGDLVSDTKELVSDSYGRAAASIEHNANSLFWALDNVIYTSEHDWHLRLKNGTFEIVPTLPRGQWGASMDDAGRVYRNVNDAPLFVDFLPPRYYIRNPNLVRTRGLYEPLISREDSTIWPVRATRGVNRGYRDQFFRPDDSSVTIQGVGTPVVYRGDQLPKALYGDAFITDSTTNLVHDYDVVDDGTGRLHAEDAFKKGEILASTDERFRPVNMLGAPDGTLWVVDMYRGIVQEQIYWTDYLRDYIEKGDLKQPVHLGRIWRIVHASTRPVERPALSKATPAQLVETLSHPNGWWRDKAQQLLVQRQATEAVPALKTLAASAPDWRTRLHALWTLDGLGATDPSLVQARLADDSADVRATAIRLLEPSLVQAGAPAAAAVLKLMDDPSWTVRRQLAASIGALPAAARLDPAVTILQKYGSDAILVDATISGLEGEETTVLDRVLQGSSSQALADPVAMLAGAAAKSGDAAAVEHVLVRVTGEDTAEWQQKALLEGLGLGLPTSAGGRGGRGGRGAAPVKAVTLAAEPASLVRLSSTPGEVGELAKRVVDRLEWTGKPAPVVTSTPLTPEEQARFTAGGELYRSICLGCHQADGRGKEGIAPTLVESPYVLSPDAGNAMRILLSGKEGKVGLMPPLGGALSDEQIAAVLTYIRREWGHTASPVAPEDVQEVRGLTKTRTKPWTDEELPQGRGGRGGGRGVQP